MLARTVARRTLTSVGATRSFNKSTMNRGGAAGGHGEGHGHDDHHPHPVRNEIQSADNRLKR
jgi:hypothetical protein